MFIKILAMMLLCNSLLLVGCGQKNPLYLPDGRAAPIHVPPYGSL